MKAEQFIKQFSLFSRESKCQPASTSEIMRWLDAGNVWLNGEKITRGEMIDFPLISVVLFPKGKRVTLL